MGNKLFKKINKKDTSKIGKHLILSSRSSWNNNYKQYKGKRRIKKKGPSWSHTHRSKRPCETREWNQCSAATQWGCAKLESKKIVIEYLNVLSTRFNQRVGIQNAATHPLLKTKKLILERLCCFIFNLNIFSNAFCLWRKKKNVVNAHRRGSHSWWQMTPAAQEKCAFRKDDWNLLLSHRESQGFICPLQAG